MLSFTQLREQLQLSQPALTKLIRDGLPHQVDGRTKVFDSQAVAQWLVKTGRAVVEGQEDASKIARTRRECADHFGVHLRTVADWLEDPTFPGKSGTRGLRDGYFPLEEIADWQAKRDALRAGGPQTDGCELRDQLLAVRIRRENVRTERDELSLEEEQGRLTTIDAMMELVTRQINIAKTLLEALPDEAAKSMPETIDASVRAAVVRRWRDRIYEAERVLSETIAGDTDDTDENE
jgi:phage terminase Nu1 subunit (DNA packaging protein)